MRSKIVNSRELKKILDRDSSIKHSGAFFYNDSVVYACNNSKDMHEAVDYYFNLENRITKLTDENLIRELIWKNRARPKGDGKFLCEVEETGESGYKFAEGRVYDGGDFAKEEYKKYWEAKVRKLYGKENNEVLERVAKEILEKEVVRITKEAKEKAHKISERMGDISGPNEIYLEGINFSDKKDDPAIRDIYINENQTANPTRCFLNAGSAKMTMKNLEKDGKYEVAWIHSHANMFPWPSGIDDINLKRLTPINGETIEISSSMLGVRFKSRISIYRSLIFNAIRTEPYAEIGMRYTLTDGKEEKTMYNFLSKKNVPLLILNENNGIDSSIASIDQQIIKRVNWPGKPSVQSLEKSLTESYTRERAAVLERAASYEAPPYEISQDYVQAEVSTPQQKIPRSFMNLPRYIERAGHYYSNRSLYSKISNLLDSLFRRKVKTK